MIPLTATAASAAVNSVTTNPSTYKVAAGQPVTVTADVTTTAGDTTPIRFAIVSGPDADKAGNGTLVADGLCSTVAVTTTTSTASCTFTNNGTAGTDVVRVFADSNLNNAVDSGEASSDATVVFYGTAFAVDLQPPSDTAAVGTCNAFTATVTDVNGVTVPSQAVKLEANLTGTASAGRSLTFCDPGTTNPTSTNAGGGTTAVQGTPATGTVTTDSTGKATFGITSNQPGTASVLAYVDNNGTPGFQAGEPSDTSTKTFTAGGADAVSTLSASPSSANSYTGNLVTYKVTAKNSSGDTVAAVTPNAAVTGANAGAAVTCGATDNSGVATCTYTPTAAGTDTLTFWINQTTGGTSGPDASEPKTTATDTVTAAPSGNAITLTCVDITSQTAGTACTDPTTDSTEVFTAHVTKAGNDVAGILVQFSVASSNSPSGASVSPVQAVTDSKGLASTTLTDSKHSTDGTVDTVTATIAGQTPATSATATKTFQKAVATNVTLAPAVKTTQVGTASTFVATVTDQFNAPVSGANVDFSFDAGSRNVALNPSGYNKTTNANGQASFTYTDTGNQALTGTDSLTATVDLNNNDVADAGEPQDTATNNFITQSATASNVDLAVTDVCPSTDPANDTQSYAPSYSANEVCVTVKNANGTALAGKTVTFTTSGVGTFVTADGTLTTSPQTAVTDASGQARVQVRSTQSGDQTITATADSASDTGVITYNAPRFFDAWNIDLQPNSSTIHPGSQELTARVTDRFGNPVPGVNVSFTEAGVAAFSNGTSSSSATTGSTGIASVTLVAANGTTGTDTVDAQMPAYNCPSAADSTTNPPTPAANCTDSSTYTYTAAPPAGSIPSLATSANYIVVGQSVNATVTGTPGELVQLLGANNQNKTFVVFRQANIGSNGTVTFFNIAPKVNSYVQARTVEGASNTKAIGVRPIIHMTATLVGSNTGVFTGTVAPGPAGRIVTIYYVTPTGVFPAINTTVDSNGNYRASRTFVHNTRLLFVALTRPDDQNISNRSEIRTFTTR